jgi:hypothetical protein
VIQNPEVGLQSEVMEFPKLGTAPSTS